MSFLFEVRVGCEKRVNNVGMNIIFFLYIIFITIEEFKCCSKHIKYKPIVIINNNTKSFKRLKVGLMGKMSVQWILCLNHNSQHLDSKNAT